MRTIGLWHFMQIVSYSNLKYKWKGNVRKIFQKVVCWNFYQHACKYNNAQIQIMLVFPNHNVWIFFLFLHENICCGYSLEVPSQHTFSWSLQHSFMEIDLEIFSMVILSLRLIQEGQFSVSSERMCTILVNCFRVLSLPNKGVVR